MHTSSNRGFTLIELLVVIAIIALLSTVVLASLNTARSKARDAQSIASLLELRKSIEAYYADNGVYPPTCDGLAAKWRGDIYSTSPTVSCPTNYIDGLVPTYISRLPVRVGSAGQGYIYQTNATRSDYKVILYGSVENFDASHPLADNASCPTSRVNSYSVHSAAALCW